MRSRVPLFALLFLIGSFVLPPVAHAVGIPFFGPLLPEGMGSACPGGLAMLLEVANRVISFLITLAIVFIAPIMIAYAGFLFVINGVNPHGMSEAKGILTHTVVGIVIALASWMIVNAVMAALYNGSAGSWSSIVRGGDFCVQQAGAIFDGQGHPVQTPSTGSGVTVTPQSTATAGSIPARTGYFSYTINSASPSGSASLTFNTIQPDAGLQTGYTAANQYSAQINQACAGSSIPNCGVVLTSLIAQESGGRPATGCNSYGACGLMQVLRGAGGASCATTDTGCIRTQVGLGLEILQRGYNQFGSVSNALASYNSGISTTPGQSVSGRNSAMVDSTDCPGLYAWQCSKNPGGLVETQGYVANICRNIALHNGSCN